MRFEKRERVSQDTVEAAVRGGNYLQSCCWGQQPLQKTVMRLNKSIGMILLAIYLILDALLGFGLNIGPFVFLLYLVALVAGIFILIGK
jgi:hypothetical protein